jgi:hypothetical protein
LLFLIKKPIVFEVDSQPPGALCTLHYQEKEEFGSPITAIGETPFKIVDPVRFSYTTCPVRLETASGRKTALKIGREYNAKAVMIKEMILSSPRQPREIPRPGEIFFPDSNLSS